MVRILVVDDSAEALQCVARAVRFPGSEVATAQSSREAMQRIAEETYDVILTDLKMETAEAGLEILKAAKAKDALTQVILITAYGTPEISGMAMSLGAFDYFEKNSCGTDVFSMITSKVNLALDFRSAKLDVLSGKTSEVNPTLEPRTAKFEDLLLRFMDSEPWFQRFLEKAKSIANSGSGLIGIQPNLAESSRAEWRESLYPKATARLIHALSSRRLEPFIRVDSAANHSRPLQALLFGDLQSSDRGGSGLPGALELADKGTLFLENVETLPRDLQEELLDTLSPSVGEDRSRFDVRLLASTGLPLKRLRESLCVLDGLYYYLSGWSLEVPTVSTDAFSIIEMLVDGYLDRLKLAATSSDEQSSHL